MSPIREQLVGVIDCLPETEQSFVGDCPPIPTGRYGSAG